MSMKCDLRTFNMKVKYGCSVAIQPAVTLIGPGVKTADHFFFFLAIKVDIFNYQDGRLQTVDKVN